MTQMVHYLRPYTSRKIHDARWCVSCSRCKKNVPAAYKTTSTSIKGKENLIAYSCKNLSTACAAPRPSAIAHTTRLCPRRASPAAKTPGTLVA